MRSWGCQKNASAAEIKSAFRKLAKKLHPDANKNDPKAATQFAELNAAYEIVGDEDKRKAFDRGEIDAEGKPRFQGFEGSARHPGAGPARAVRADGSSRASPGARTASSAAPGGGGGGGGGGIEDILRGMFGGAARRRRRAHGGIAASSRRISARRRRARIVTRRCTITLPRPPSGTKARVHLPTGKEIDVKIPAGLADGQTDPAEGAGHGRARAARPAMR